MKEFNPGDFVMSTLHCHPVTKEPIDESPHLYFVLGTGSEDRTLDVYDVEFGERREIYTAYLTKVRL